MVKLLLTANAVLVEAVIVAVALGDLAFHTLRGR